MDILPYGQFADSPDISLFGVATAAKEQPLRKRIKDK